jgi:hypothetical protein
MASRREGSPSGTRWAIPEGIPRCRPSPPEGDPRGKVSGSWRATATQQPAGRAGCDVVLVADLFGHARLNSTRQRPELASAAERAVNDAGPAVTRSRWALMSGSQH